MLTLQDGFIFYKLRFKIDRSGIFILIVIYLAQLVRTFQFFLPPLFFNIPNQTCQRLIDISLCYFIFEMNLIKQALTNDNPQIFLRKKIILYRIKWTFLGFYCFLIFLACVLIEGTQSCERKKIKHVICDHTKVLCDESSVYGCGIRLRETTVLIWKWNSYKQQ